MTFNKNRFRELLRYSQDLKQKGEELPKSDFNELLSYSVALSNQLVWESRDYYAELMSQFLNGEISQYTLASKYRKMEESQEEVLEALKSNLIILSVNPNSADFADLIDGLYWIFEDLPLDSTLSLEELTSLIEENKYEEAEKQKERRIYNSIKKIYLKIQKYFD